MRPSGIDELAVAGGVRGEPLELVRCETVDLEVPADAEMVIEGEISTETLEAEGPFGEFTGYMAGGRECPVFTAKCITHRQDPILLGLISQFRLFSGCGKRSRRAGVGLGMPPKSVSQGRMRP